MLTASDYPWEQILLQGLQNVPGVGTGLNVHYHVDFDLVCAAELPRSHRST